MTKENYFKLKEELKELAKEIKSNKINFKTTQRNISGFRSGHKDAIDTRGYKNGKEWEEIRPKFNNLYSMESSLRNSVESKKHEYRHKHIVYSLIRGRTYKQIEGKVREGNEPSWSYIEKLKEEYDFDFIKEKEEVTV